MQSALLAGLILAIYIVAILFWKNRQMLLLGIVLRAILVNFGDPFYRVIEYAVMIVPFVLGALVFCILQRFSGIERIKLSKSLIFAPILTAAGVLLFIKSEMPVSLLILVFAIWALALISADRKYSIIALALSVKLLILMKHAVVPQVLESIGRGVILAILLLRALKLRLFKQTALIWIGAAIVIAVSLANPLAGIVSCAAIAVLFKKSRHSLVISTKKPEEYLSGLAELLFALLIPLPTGIATFVLAALGFVVLFRMKAGHDYVLVLILLLMIAHISSPLTEIAAQAGLASLFMYKIGLLALQTRRKWLN